MARIRTVKPEFFTNDKLSSLPAEMHLFAAGLLCQSDDEGYFLANPTLLQAAILPLRDYSVSAHGILNELSRIEFIRLGEGVDGRAYGHIINFLEHQVVNRPKPSKIKDLPIKWERLAVADSASVTDHGVISGESVIDHGSITGERKEGKGKEGSVCAAQTPPHTEGMGPDGFARGLVAIWQEHEQVPGSLGLQRDIAEQLPNWATEKNTTIRTLAIDIRAKLKLYLDSPLYKSGNGPKPKWWFLNGNWGDDPALWQTDGRRHQEETGKAEPLGPKYIAGTVEDWLSHDPSEWRFWKERNPRQFENYMSTHPEDFYRYQKANPQ